MTDGPATLIVEETPHSWVGLFSFLAYLLVISLVASQLSPVSALDLVPRWDFIPDVVKICCVIILYPASSPYFVTLVFIAYCLYRSAALWLAGGLAALVVVSLQPFLSNTFWVTLYAAGILTAPVNGSTPSEIWTSSPVLPLVCVEDSIDACILSKARFDGRCEHVLGVNRRPDRAIDKVFQRAEQVRWLVRESPFLGGFYAELCGD